MVGQFLRGLQGPMLPQEEILIPIGDYKSDSVPLGGKYEQTAPMTADEVEAFNADYITLLRLAKQIDKAQDLMRILRQNVELVFDTVRVEKVKVNQAFDGKLGNGNGLMLDLFTPMMFGNNTIAGPPTTRKFGWGLVEVQNTTITWIGAPAVGALPNGCIPTNASFFTLDRYAALVLMATYLPDGTSGIVGGYNVYKNGQILGGWSKDSDAYQITEFTEPLVAIGEEQIRVDAYPCQSGTDWSKPWGVAIFQANRVRPISARSPLLNA